jgi:hypothetical protein
VGNPLATSSDQQVTEEQARADPTSLFRLANGLQARVVSTQAAPTIDQISLWPNDANPEWLIACNGTHLTRGSSASTSLPVKPQPS